MQAHLFRSSMSPAVTRLRFAASLIPWACAPRAVLLARHSPRPLGAAGTDRRRPARRHEGLRGPAAISIITPGEFAQGFSDPRAIVEFLAPFRVVTLSRAIAWRTAALQSSLSRRLGENDAWIAATALSYEATLIGREKAFARVPRLDYLSF
jgi:predicted nucleic acid-binding protein